MRKFSANYIFDGLGNFYKNGILKIDDDGSIIELIDTNGNLVEENKLEFYNGIITPGFVNSHCHLELSYLKNKIKEGTSLPNFISSVLENKHLNIENANLEMKNADEQMKREGIVAVGDISNNSSSFQTKINSKIKYHTFIELIGIDANDIDKIEIFARNIKKEAQKLNLSNNYTPHATYSVSEKLLKFITDDAYKTNSIISIHNQETESENEMFLEAKGELLKSLQKINPYYKKFKPSLFNSLPSTMINLPKCNKTLLVHNTFTSEKDIKWVNNYTKYAYWCLCPKSNLFIENKLPNINLFANEKVCIGTDSLASNTSLSILEELKTINFTFPNIDLVILLKWATYNGAEALNLQDKIGSFEKGKIPGINLIENINFTDMAFNEQSRVKVLF